ncbi:MAG: DAK2 domain-containing protein [Trueperaceae bacterium]|nr:DAK2 domain-containing protein [Trueperaceae bacterium]
MTAERDVLEVRDLVNAFIYATDWLGVYTEEVNALNVYPVPDGDTGTNMHLTMQSVRRQLSDASPKTLHDFAHALSYGSLLGARGNSGVILSQVLKGFAETVREQAHVGSEACVAALQNATKTAYAAVVKPVEGTILTVVRRAADGARDRRSKLPLQVLRDALEAGQKALEETPDMLPVLKQAGVVDAGGLGFLRLLEGIIAAFEGRDLPAPPKIEKRAQQQFEEEVFGFCTEFLLSDVNVPVEKIRDITNGYGDSLLVVEAEGFVKGHVHTEEPEKLLGEIARYGTMVRSKVEDMSEQHSEILGGVDLTETEASPTALVAVSGGYGVTKVFRSLGARVVGGGQTNNPSVQDIADAVRSVGSQDVIVLPNNKNIILAAERVNELVPEKTVHVLPTRTLGQGLAAAVLFNENDAAAELIADMEDAAANAVTLEVTVASRSTTVNGVTCVEGECIGMANAELVAAAKEPEDVLVTMLETVADELEIGTLFHNAKIGPERARELMTRLEAAFPDLEIELHPGAPDVYDYVMALE